MSLDDCKIKPLLPEGMGALIRGADLGPPFFSARMLWERLEVIPPRSVVLLDGRPVTGWYSVPVNTVPPLLGMVLDTDTGTAGWRLCPLTRTALRRLIGGPRSGADAQNRRMPVLAEAGRGKWVKVTGVTPEGVVLEGTQAPV